MKLTSVTSDDHTGLARTAIVLAGGFDQIDLITELRSRGWRVVLIDYNKRPPAADAADLHYAESTLDIEAVLSIARKEQAALVTTACTDQALLTVAHVSAELGLRTPFSPDQVLRLTNKEWMKQTVLEHGIPSAAYTTINTDDAPPDGLCFPMVVKPVDGNSSKGVTLVTEPAHWRAAVARARAVSRCGLIVCEEYLPGIELSVDVLVLDGRPRILMVSESEKLENPEGAFPIHRSVQPSAQAIRFREEIETCIAALVKAFAITDSPMIVQLIASPEGIRVIELSARIAGGAKHRFIRAVTGYDIMRAWVDLLSQRRPPEPPQHAFLPAPPRALYCMQYLYMRPGTFDRFEGDDLLLHDGVIQEFFQTKTAGMRVGEALNSSNRVGAALLRASGQADLHQRLARLFADLRACDEHGVDQLLHPATAG